MKTILTILAITAFSIGCNAGILKGHILDKKTNEPIPFAAVQLFQDKVVLSTVQSDFDGLFSFKNLKAGEYFVKISLLGYAPKELRKIVIKSDSSLTDIQVLLESSSVEVKSFEKVEYKVPIISKDNTVTGTTITREDIQAAPTRDVNSISTTVAGVSVRGGRSEKTSYYADGLKIAKQLGPSNTEEYKYITDNEFLKVRTNPLSTFSIDVDVASYGNLRRFINRGTMPPVDAVRIEEMINYFKYDYPQPKNGEPFAISTEFGDCPWNKEHKLLHVGIQGKEIKTDNLPPSNLVFLIDVSGSMDEPDKLPLVKQSLGLLIRQLRPQDRIAVVVYAGAAGLVLPSTSGKEKQKLFDALENLSAGGSTAGGAGIELAYKIAKENFKPEGNNRVILATDGDFNVGVSNDNELVRLIEQKRGDNIFLTVLGFGTGNYKDAKMEQLADKGNGNFSYIDNLLEAQKVLVKEIGGTLFTIAKDVKIQIEFNIQNVKSYRLIGYENRLLNDRDFNDDKKDAGELGVGHHVTALYEIITKEEKTGNRPEVDSLRYQVPMAPQKSAQNEMATVKIRYKEPKGKDSKLITSFVENSPVGLSQASDNYRFSTSVAQFGMILRKSKFKGDATYDNTIALALNAKGKDEEGYRSEFIRLIGLAQDLTSEDSDK